MSRSSDRAEATKRFEKNLVAYQKIALLLMIPALLSTFWGFVPLGSAEVSAIMMLGSARLINGYAGSSFAYGGALYSLFLLIICTLCAFYAAKGKLPFYLAGTFLYAFDLVIDIMVLAFNQFGQGSVFSVVIHSVFVAGFLAGLLVYHNARKYLYEEARLKK
ncbi:MAG: hypothetical protein K6F32_06285 [Bacilli bacterium]|nr:hypothetical protein [Bacilli bacterium]